MPSPFPGMDPWLENPALWPDFHLTCIAEMKRDLNQRIAPRYVARADKRIYVSDDEDPGHPQMLIPDLHLSRDSSSKARISDQGQASATEPVIVTMVKELTVEEPYLELIDPATDKVVTVIEFLSPANKTAGAKGWEAFRANRSQVLNSDTHWVEIDLLREGVRVTNLSRKLPSDYRVLISRVEERPKVTIWPIPLRKPLPRIGIPLMSPDADIVVDLQEMVSAAYDASAYGATLNYRIDPDPPLKEADAEWAEGILVQQGNLKRR